MFTGDRSGDWLYRALYRAGFASHPESISRDDGLALTDCYITAVVRCAPPQNKPTKTEIDRCKPYLVQELSILKNLRVVVALGKVAFDATIHTLRGLGEVIEPTRSRFSHAATFEFARVNLVASYHPSQQNTFTGKLTEAMLDRVFEKARGILQ